MLQEVERVRLPELPQPYFFRARPWQLFASGAELIRVELRRRRRWGLGSSQVDWTWASSDEHPDASDAEIAAALAEHLRRGFVHRQHRVDLSGLE